MLVLRYIISLIYARYGIVQKYKEKFVVEIADMAMVRDLDYICR